MGTLGYGAMYPETLATGPVFTKFSTPSPRVFFSKNAVITPFDGVPTLMCRVGDERGDHVIDARLRMTIIRTEKNKEGQTFYRTRDLRLAREHAPTFRRGTTMMRPIDSASPLFGRTPASLADSDAELVVSIVGLDGTTSQTVYAGTSYLADEILFGRRLADTVRELPDGRVELDLGKFHDTEPSAPTDAFAYPPADADP